jgi:hypothetical protein
VWDPVSKIATVLRVYSFEGPIALLTTFLVSIQGPNLINADLIIARHTQNLLVNGELIPISVGSSMVPLAYSFASKT